ncbi:MAG: vWA domain-containing protein [Pseudomonadota bacterium]
MKENLTEIIFILDRSGSMAGLESDTIGGYNSFLEEQKKVEGEAHVTTVLFDNNYEVLHDGVDIKSVNPITRKEYFARGTTALLDAVGLTINRVVERIKKTDESQRPSKVIFIITTDGLENSSVEFTYTQVKQMVSYQQSKYNWEFLFLGANIDAAKEADSLGIKANRASNYVADSQGSNLIYGTLASSIASFRCDGVIDDNWNEEIETDIKSRRSRRS